MPRHDGLVLCCPDDYRSSCECCSLEHRGLSLPVAHSSGPYAFFLLGGIAFCITIKAFLPEKRGKLSKGSRIALLVVTIAAFIAMMVGLMISAHTRKTRSDTDFILGQWGGHR